MHQVEMLPFKLKGYIFHVTKKTFLRKNLDIVIEVIHVGVIT